MGSGASGGWVAKQLTEAGLRVAVLEAGRRLDPAVDSLDHRPPYEMPLRGQLPRAAREEQPIQRKACDAFTSHLFVKDTECPYATPPDKPFEGYRGRQVGGKSITWGRQTYRLSDYDLKAASRDGFGVDWPLDYAELAPYYDRVERFIGVSGQAEGLPQLPDGRFQPPMHLTCGEVAMRTAIKARFGRTLTIGRCAVLTAPLPGRPKCHYCGPCERGCSTGSYYSSPASTLPAAAATGRLTGYQGGAQTEKWQHAYGLGGFGKDFKSRVRTDNRWIASFWGFGECLARFENHARLDEERRDAWGIPVLHISMAFGDNERRMCKDMSEQAAEMLAASGIKDAHPIDEISTPGAAIHEVGTARMGNDPKISVVNRWQQAHDVRNLFLMDGSVYPSSACQNPTITIMALAARASDYLVDQIKQGSI